MPPHLLEGHRRLCHGVLHSVPIETPIDLLLESRIDIGHLHGGSKKVAGGLGHLCHATVGEGDLENQPITAETRACCGAAQKSKSIHSPSETQADPARARSRQ